jgi:hypothetical protein
MIVASKHLSVNQTYIEEIKLEKKERQSEADAWSV